MAMQVKTHLVTHDIFCRAMLDDPKRAHPIIKARLPKGLAKLLAGLPKPVGTELVSDQLGGLRTDAQFLYQLTTGDQLLVILEHKSSRESDTAWQLLQYQVVACQGYVRRGEAIPPIYMLVLHNGPQEWQTNPDVKSLVKGSDAVLAITGAQMAEPGFDAFSARSLVPLLGDYPESQFGCAALAAGGQSGKASVAELVALYRLLDNSRFAKLTELYIVAQCTDEDDFAKVLTAMRTVKGEGGVRRMSELRSKVLDEKWAEGIAEGEARGEARGKADTLTNLLTLKFGSVPANTERRIRRASPEELDAWAGAVLTASSLDEVFAAEPK